MVQKPDTAPFKYVTIDSDDDELVIVAGARPADVDAATPAEPGTPSEAAVSTEAESSAQEMQTSAKAPSSEEPTAAAGGASDRAVQQPPDGAPDQTVQQPASDGYRETTLDDLQHEPMSKMQRGVLIAIGVLVVVFVAYVLFF